MSEVLIFGGTTEGRLLAEFCVSNKIRAAVSVTTDYGADLLPHSDFIRELIGILDNDQMFKLIKSGDFSIVIDATHPFARTVSANLQKACHDVGMRYLRLLREKTTTPSGRLFFSIPEIVEYLNQNSVKALITTGGNSLSEYTKVHDFQHRLTVRILPAEGAAEHCIELGFPSEHVILEKGPFTVQQNVEHINKSGAEALVTKESGTAGGFPEKAEAAELCGVELLTLLRPAENGYSLEQIEQMLVSEVI